MGAIIVALRSKMKIRRIVLAFVDSTSNYSNGINTQSNMQTILDTYRKLCKATGESIQLEKSFYYLWMWKIHNGKQVVVNCDYRIKIKDEELKQIPAK